MCFANLNSLVVASCLLMSMSANSQQVTNSEKYRWLETDSAERTRFILDSNNQVNALYKKSKNRKNVETFFKEQLDSPMQGPPHLFKDQYLLINSNGLGKGSELVLLDATQTQTQVLFSSLQLAKNGAYAFENIYPSPNNRYILMAFSKHGSTDDYAFYIFDFEAKKVVGPEITTTIGYPSWTSASTFSVMDIDSNCRNFSVPDGAELATGCKTSPVNSDLAGKISFVAMTKSYFYYQDLTATGTSIFRVSVTDQTKYEAFFEDKNKIIFAPTSVGENTVVVPLSWGGKQVLKIFSEQTKAEIGEVQIPSHLGYRQSAWAQEPNWLKIDFQGEALPAATLLYDVINKRFDPTELKSTLLMLNSDAEEIVSEDLQIPSLDGTLIPTRITRRKATTLNGNNPVYFYVYGGFGVSTFAPTFDLSSYVFLIRGGILVDAAVRGGNDFGNDWQKAAQLENKCKTFEDVAAVGKYLSQAGYTHPNKIVLSGGSNGGFVVAATAQMFPNVFGLVIATNGVQDMLRRQPLDKKSLNGWAFEYGDLSDEKVQAYEKLFSPVELAKNGPGANFLIINGRQDTRVHPSHSFKLKAALSDANQKNEKMVLMTSINNSGHQVENLAQNWTNWRAESLKWSLIFDFLGMEF